MDASVAPHYLGTKGEEYARTHGMSVTNSLGYRLQSKFFKPYLRQDMHVLDFGCGNGALAEILEAHVGAIDGLEVNPHMRDRAVKRGLNVYESIASLPNDKRFDAIISNHVLEHIPDVVTTLKKLREYLADGGVFITMVPIEDFRTRRNRRWRSNDKDHHLHTWTPLLFGNTLQEAGFIPNTLEVITSAWMPRAFFLGETWLQQSMCYLTSRILRRRQLRAVASVIGG